MMIKSSLMIKVMVLDHWNSKITCLKTGYGQITIENEIKIMVNLYESFLFQIIYKYQRNGVEMGPQ